MSCPPPSLHLRAHLQFFEAWKTCLFVCCCSSVRSFVRSKKLNGNWRHPWVSWDLSIQLAPSVAMSSREWWWSVQSFNSFQRFVRSWKSYKLGVDHQQHNILVSKHTHRQSGAAAQKGRRQRRGSGCGWGVGAVTLFLLWCQSNFKLNFRYNTLWIGD